MLRLDTSDSLWRAPSSQSVTSHCFINFASHTVAFCSEVSLLHIFRVLCVVQPSLLVVRCCVHRRAVLIYMYFSSACCRLLRAVRFCTGGSVVVGNGSPLSLSLFIAVVGLCCPVCFLRPVSIRAVAKVHSWPHHCDGQRATRRVLFHFFVSFLSPRVYTVQFS